MVLEQASIWTQDLDKAEKLSRMIRYGTVTVNNVVIFDPSAFWWSKGFGILEFVNIKTV